MGKKTSSKCMKGPLVTTTHNPVTARKSRQKNAEGSQCNQSSLLKRGVDANIYRWCGMLGLQTSDGVSTFIKMGDFVKA